MHRIHGVKKGKVRPGFRNSTFGVSQDEERHEDAFSTSLVSHPTNPSPVDFVPSNSVCAMASALDVFANRFLDSSRVAGLRFRADHHLDVTSHRVVDLENKYLRQPGVSGTSEFTLLAGSLAWAFVRYWIFAPCLAIPSVKTPTLLLSSARLSGYTNREGPKNDVRRFGRRRGR
jgi:hypothetical protein